jgi:hypothetical protein
MNGTLSHRFDGIPGAENPTPKSRNSEVFLVKIY